MGTADAIPGVSGGTIAFITGIYPRLVHAINQISTALKLLIERKFKQAINIIDWKLFIPLILGIGIALILFSGIISFLLESFPSTTFAFFFGLIFASGIIMVKHVKIIRYEHIVFGVFGFIFAWIIAGLSEVSSNHSLIIVFFSAMIAITAMILPGISGAFILVLLGQYQYLVSAIHEFNFRVIFTFGVGAFLGLVLFSKILDYLLKKWNKIVISFLIGLMLGSLKVPWQKMIILSENILFLIIAGIFGFIVVLILEHYFNK